jgi:hypothetical protein
MQSEMNISHGAATAYHSPTVTAMSTAICFYSNVKHAATAAIGAAITSTDFPGGGHAAGLLVLGGRCGVFCTLDLPNYGAALKNYYVTGHH